MLKIYRTTLGYNITSQKSSDGIFIKPTIYLFIKHGNNIFTLKNKMLCFDEKSRAYFCERRKSNLNAHRK